MYGGRHTWIVLCCLVGHKTVVSISKKHHHTIPKATCHPKTLVLPGTVQKWPFTECNPKHMLDGDADLSHPGVPSMLHCCQHPDWHEGSQERHSLHTLNHCRAESGSAPGGLPWLNLWGPHWDEATHIWRYSKTGVSWTDVTHWHSGKVQFYNIYMENRQEGTYLTQW